MGKQEFPHCLSGNWPLQTREGVNCLYDIIIIYRPISTATIARQLSFAQHFLEAKLWIYVECKEAVRPHPCQSQSALNQISQRSDLVFLRYIWVILLSRFPYINYMNDYFVRSSITIEHKSGGNTTAYHNSLVQTAYFCSLCKYCMREKHGNLMLKLKH